ncbi:MAG TPA: integrase core domain-containing protein [Steroidobacteraceae bacterium]
MPWRERSTMSERLAFVQACLDRATRMEEICARFGVSEKTGYKLLRRFRSEGMAGLAERSHARHTQAHRMSAEVAAAIVALRKKHRLYGPVKLRDWLMQHDPERHWPAASSIGALLHRAGLIAPRRRRPSGTRALSGRTAATAPNHVWTADFKGEFRLTSGPYCYPLTVLDLHSHCLLDCVAQTTTAVAPARAAFVRLFRTYGLPDVLRTDNGVPFAQPNALGRLGALAFWWVRLGIRPEHTTPATPSENGAHERFHKTLKAATTQPAAPSLTAQQRRFDHFRAEYNTERPHASLPQHRPPAQLYTPSPRAYPARLPALWYPAATDVRLVSASGVLKWRNHRVFLSTNLAGQYVGLAETVADLVTIRYAALALGELDLHTHEFTPRVRWIDAPTSESSYCTASPG